jgi:signal transduction histidine kinase
VSLLRSLRSRVILGALLWTLGLLTGTYVLARVFSHQHRIVFELGHGALLIIPVLFLLGGLSGLRSGLIPFQRLRDRLSAVRDGREHRLEGRYPSEVQPLVDDLNALLEHREQMVRRALARSGDLAHGLKTPLAVLGQEAERARAAGHGELAATLAQQVERMRRQVDHHLAHARAATSGSTPGARCAVLASAEGLARTLQRLHAERRLSLRVEVSPEHWVRGQREDVDEMLGNLLDNACAWARSTVVLSSAEESGMIVLTVDDDGPGIAPELRDRALQRGMRADEVSSGTGLGLAIVRDLAELYGGSIRLSASPGGGLRAQLRLPAAARTESV